MTEEVMWLPPKKGSKGYLVAVIFLLCLWLILLSFSIYVMLFSTNVGYRDPMFALIIFFLVPLAILGVYGKIGKHVMLSKNGISKPMMIKKQKTSFIPYKEILWYMKKYSPLTDEVDSVLIMTRQNRKVIYHDILTPGCVNAIIEKLQEHGIEERFPSTGREKYGR